MKNFYEILDIAPDSSTEVIKKKFISEMLKYDHKVLLSEKQAEERRQELITAYGVLINKEHRGRYDKHLLSGDTASFKMDLPETWSTLYGSSSGSLKSGTHDLKFGTQTLFSGITNHPGTFVMKDSFTPFLGYLDASTNRLNKLKKNPRYTPISEKMDSLSGKIKNSIKSLEDLPDKEAVIKVLNSCADLLVQAQKDASFNAHRGFVRRTPVLSQLSFVLDVTIRLLEFAFMTIFAPLLACTAYTPPHKDEPYYGLFRQEKTKTASEIDALANDVQEYIAATNKI